MTTASGPDGGAPQAAASPDTELGPGDRVAERRSPCAPTAWRRELGSARQPQAARILRDSHALPRPGLREPAWALQSPPPRGPCPKPAPLGGQGGARLRHEPEGT
ncbi:MAG: hypothetical protein MZV63_37435 [Marinilabiliales bacterium]|nr:hypothetical protein [Marinilabiliales bacterium]